MLLTKAQEVAAIVAEREAIKAEIELLNDLLESDELALHRATAMIKYLEIQLEIEDERLRRL